MRLDTVVLVAAVVLVAGASVTSLLAHVRYRRPRVVACPGDGRPAAVTLDARQAALTAATGSVLRVESCSSWPERRLCGQRCLEQVAQGGGSAAIVRILEPWYASRKCVGCGGEFRHLWWSEYPPALMDGQGRHRPWFAVPPEHIAVGLETGVFRPVCWRCYVLATPRREA